MAKVPILLALLSQLLCTLLQVSGQQSPCPQYFMYVNDPATNDMMGQIEIPSPPKNVELHLKVALSINVDLPTNYVGQLELAQSKEESVRAVQQGRPLLYHLHFPLRQPITLLTGLWFNNQQYCSGPPATGQIVTSIQLEHTLYPPNVLPPSLNAFENIVFPSSHLEQITPPTFIYMTSPPPQSTQRPPNQLDTTERPPNHLITTQRRKKKPTTSHSTTVSLSDGIANNIFLNPSIQQSNNNHNNNNNNNQPPPQSNNNNINNNEECGVSTHPNNMVNLLIAKGMKTMPGQWPWLVAIFIVRLQYEFQCAGSILTNKHIITAAHCCKLDKTNIPANVMSVSLGRYRLRDFREEGSINKYVEKYTIHPDYLDQITGDSDLAILILRDPVEFSPRIKPVCIWNGPTDLQSVVDKIGYVVGWGQDEFGNSYLMEPQMTKVPIVSQEVCLWSDPQFVAFTSNRTFCAGMLDGSGPCNGDSGSGLVIHDSTTGHYQLRGIVSRSLHGQGKFTCDLYKYVVFVDVAKYLPWIQQQIST